MIYRNPENSIDLANAERPQSPGLANVATESRRITLFAVPKPFSKPGLGPPSSIDLIQRNAIRSWSQLQPKIDVLLIGDEPGIKRTAEELGVGYADGLEVNHLGTPLLSSAFEIAHQNSTSPFLAYCNCDVILTNDFVHSIERIADCGLDDFVAFGRRTDLELTREIDFTDRQQIEALKADCQARGRQAPVVCKEYFVFPRGSYSSIPDFAVGRGNWDNWMIHAAKQAERPVVDLSGVVSAIHQDHSYRHVGKGRWGCYVSGEEARENQRLAGGRNVISGSTATWQLDDRGLRKVPLSRLNLAFWADVPRFLRLMTNLIAGI